MRWFCLLAVLFLCPGISVANSNSLFLCGQTIELGMPKQEVTTLFNDSGCELHSIGNDSFIILKKKPDKGICGSVSFFKDKVSWIGKDWGLFKGDSAFQAANAIRKILSQYEGQHFTVSTKEYPNPDHSLFEIKFSKADYQITILMTSEEIGQSVTVQEGLKNP